MRTSIPILFLLPATVALAYEAAPTDPKKLHGYQWMNRHNAEWLPELAARYGCEIVDVRGPFLDYLKDHGLKPADVLNDGAHFNFQGDYLIAELTERHLRYDAALPRKPWENLVRTYEIGRDVQWVNGKLELEFEGNRVDAIAGWGDPFYGGEAEVRIDGRPPSQRPELYHITRPTDTFSVDWPGVNRIGAEKPLLVEDWTLKVLEVNADESRLRFEVAGSKTGPDGGGESTERFVSKSGRVVIDPEDWTFARSFALVHRSTPPGFEVTWSVEPMFVNMYRAPRVEDR